jgi:hypothetical protein
MLNHPYKYRLPLQPDHCQQIQRFFVHVRLHVLPAVINDAFLCICRICCLFENHIDPFNMFFANYSLIFKLFMSIYNIIIQSRP